MAGNDNRSKIEFSATRRVPSEGFWAYARETENVDTNRTEWNEGGNTDNVRKRTDREKEGRRAGTK
jgi:hypothetical protein